MPRLATPPSLTARGAALGRRVAQRRHECGLTQNQLAEQSGVDLQTLRKLERGQIASPRLFGMVDLAAVLQTSLDQLVTPRPPLVASLGYEGQHATRFIQEIAASGVNCVVDVRLTPLSRKKGFSKTALREALAEVGVGYDHRPALGNPRDNRPLFAGTQLEIGRSRYRAHLQTSEAQADLQDLASRAHLEHLALLCFEADEARCHRSVVLEEMAQLG